VILITVQFDYKTKTLVHKILFLLFPSNCLVLKGIKAHLMPFSLDPSIKNLKLKKCY